MAIRLAQLFSVDDSQVPEKVSLYLKRVGSNLDSYFRLDSGVSVIDTTNFSAISSSTNKIILKDTVSGFTGNGYMEAVQVGGSGLWSSVEYPLISPVENAFDLHIRARATTGTLRLKVFIDGNLVNTIVQAAGTSWAWYSTSFVLPDNLPHVLSLKLEENGNAIDKLYISEDTVTPSASGPEYSDSPFATIHLSIYETLDQEPTDPLFVYDYKTTLDEIKIDDWYNFNIKTLDNSVVVFSGVYSIVVSSTGGSKQNFVIWEMIDNDEYVILPSAIKVIDV